MTNWNCDVTKTITEKLIKQDLDTVNAILSPNDGLFLSYDSDFEGGIYSALKTKEFSDDASCRIGHHRTGMHR